MKRMRVVNLGAALLALIITVGAGVSVLPQTVAAQGRGAQAPRLDVDPLWPKPFPVEKHWIIGSVTGVAVDAQDHIWVTHRGVDSLQNNEKGPTLTPWASECCFSAPQVLEFDAAGTLLNSWGAPGPGYTWPQNPSGIAVDAKGNVWIAAAGAPVVVGRGRGPAPAAAPGAAAPGRGAPPAAGAPASPPAAAARGTAPSAPPAPGDAHVLKFARDGKFILQIGTAGKMEGPDSRTSLNRPSALAIDNAASELYVADTGNRRIVVFDANTGAYKRHWGGSGEAPTTTAPPAYDPAAPPARQFRDVTCVKIAKDGMVYVCDRASNRVQVFQKNGTFVKEMVIAKDTRVEGSVWGLAFSNDPQERYLYVADGVNKTVWVLQRDTLGPISRFGDGGRYPGKFYAVGSIAVDSRGNVYTGENSEGKRVQKWNYRGLGAAQPLN